MKEEEEGRDLLEDRKGEMKNEEEIRKKLVRRKKVGRR